MRLERTVRRLRDLIVEACRPELVVLFGSYAKGQDNRDSDIDLLVVVDAQGPAAERALELRGLVYGLPIAVDLHLLTPDQVETAQSNRFDFVSSAIASGVVLHSTPRGKQLLTGRSASARVRSVGKT